MMNTLMVTGTEPGAGATVVSCLVLRAAQRRGWRTAAFKPCETGFALPAAIASVPAAVPLFALNDAGAADPPDIAHAIDVDRDPGHWPPHAYALARTARCLHRGREAVVPYVFADPSEPAVAARRAGSRVLLHVLETRLRALASASEMVVVETAGGLAVPVTRAHDYGALAAQWKMPLLIVARPGRGTLNHAALTVRYARERGLSILGIVLNRGPAISADAMDASDEELARITRVPVLGRVPELRDVDIARGVFDGFSTGDDAIDWDALFSRWETTCTAAPV